MRIFTLTTHDPNGTPLTISFGVEGVAKNPDKPMFMKIDSGTYTPMYYYVSRLASVTISPSDPGDSFNVWSGPMEYKFTKDAWGWNVEYLSASPIFTVN